MMRITPSISITIALLGAVSFSEPGLGAERGRPIFQSVEKVPYLSSVTPGKESPGKCPELPAVSTETLLLRHESIRELRAKRLGFPLSGVDPEIIKGSFYEKRGCRMHEAADVLAPRNTPVRALEGGKIARLFLSKAGGITLYQYDPSERFVYYYAHLERYPEHLKQGDQVERGQIIGYVGTSGNAPPETPHLHFSISRLADGKRWWKGIPLDPYEVFKAK